MSKETILTMASANIKYGFGATEEVGFDMAELGLGPEDNELVKRLIRKPNGIIIVTGPTGCGKTTTLYSALNELNDIEKALVLLFLEDKNYKEISETLGISEVNARVKMNRVKNKLRTILNP